jgi:hypothetical protein
MKQGHHLFAPDAPLPVWSQLLLLVVLAYEGAGALFGGALLILAPDDRLMNMPVEIMHGVFGDFLVPGIILALLGLITASAFFATLRRKPSDWLPTTQALGGWYAWFVAQILILRELH